MAKISIIVPVYNVEKYLSKCIDSILNQSFKDFELILVNDGSTDNSGKICDEYKKNNTNITVIHKKNGGLSSARNTGLSICKGEYIAFIDSDDYIHPKMFEVLYNNLILYAADISICDYERVIEKTENKVEEINNIVVKQYDNIEAIERLYTEDNAKFIICCNKLYKRELFNNIKFENGKYHEDEYIIPKILYKCKKVIFNDCKLYYYLIRPGSITGKGFNIHKLDALDAFEERIKFFEENNLIQFRNKAEYDYLCRVFKYYFTIEKYIPNNKQILINIKRNFKKMYKKLKTNSYYSTKEKITWILFIINPKLYKLYINYKKKEGSIDYYITTQEEK